MKRLNAIHHGFALSRSLKDRAWVLDAGQQEAAVPWRVLAYDSDRSLRKII